MDIHRGTDLSDQVRSVAESRPYSQPTIFQKDEIARLVKKDLEGQMKQAAKNLFEAQPRSKESRG